MSADACFAAGLGGDSVRGFLHASGNVLSAHSVVVDSERCLVQSDGVRIAALGVKDLVIVASGSEILICPRDRTQETRRIVEDTGGPP